MKITIVNKHDEIVGAKNRGELSDGDIYRVSGLIVKNSKGEMLLAQRAFTKDHDPGKWGPAVAGTVEEGETYESNIIKEAEEELGIKGVAFKMGPKERIARRYNYFAQWFIAHLDWDIADFKIRKVEVEAVKWISEDDLKKELQSHPESYLSNVPRYFEIGK